MSEWNAYKLDYNIEENKTEMDLLYMIKSRIDSPCFSQCGSILSLALIGHPDKKVEPHEFFFKRRLPYQAEKKAVPI